MKNSDNHTEEWKVADDDTSGIEFEWNPKKASVNFVKHKVSFHEASTVLSDPLSVTFPDPDHSIEEEREITIGLSDRFRLLMISHTQRGNRIRIISARELTQSEREEYEKGN